MNSAMKNIKFDIDRIILQLLIPGIFAVLPYFLIFINAYDEAKCYFKASEGICTTVLFILSISVGLVLEDIGSLIEFNIWDKINIKKYPKHNEEWERYLKLDLPVNTDLIAQRYLRTVLIRMKFELSFGVALILMMIGLIILNYQIQFISSKITFIIVCIAIPFIISYYILWKSWNSSKLLIKTRKKILDRFENKDKN